MRYVGTASYEVERYGESDIERYGIQLMPETYSSDEVVVTENTLSLGGQEVVDYRGEVSRFSALSNQIPRHYVIYTYNTRGQYNSFECGFDLLSDGRAWEGISRTEHNTISDALAFLKEKLGEEFTISLEEPMRV